MSIFKEYYLNIITKKYLQFSGRASRSEFWYFLLFNFFITMFLGTLDLTLFFSDIQLPSFMIEDIEVPINLALIYWILTLIPFIALMFRRLHDIGKSALWLLLLLIPLLGFLILSYFFAKAGDKEQNKYGENPLADGNFQPKPMGALTIVAIIVLLMVANIAFMILVLGASLAGLALSLQNEMNNFMDVEQKVTSSKSTMSMGSTKTKDNKLTIKIPLTANYALKYSNIKLCTPDDKKDDVFFAKVIADNYATSSSCSNDICKVSIGIDDKTNYPTDVQMWVKDSSGKCNKEKMPAQSPALASYSAKIKLTPKLLSSMGVKDNKYKISSKNTSNYSSFSINGVKVIKFEYNEKLDIDTILINDKPKVTIIFDHIAKVSKAIAEKIEKPKKAPMVKETKTIEKTNTVEKTKKVEKVEKEHAIEKTKKVEKIKKVEKVMPEKKTISNSSKEIEKLKAEIEELKKRRETLKKQAQTK